MDSIERIAIVNSCVDGNTKGCYAGAFLGTYVFDLIEKILSPIIQKIAELAQAAWNSITNHKSSSTYQIKNANILKTGVKNELA
jgi:hypothetical protein